MKRVAIIDFDWAGHVPMYHVLWAKALLEMGYGVSSYSPQAQSISEKLGHKELLCKPIPFQASTHKTYNYNPRSIQGTMKIVEMLKRYEAYQLFKTMYFWFNAAGLIKASGVNFDRVLFPYLDKKLLSRMMPSRLQSFVFPFQWSGLLVAPKDFRNPKPCLPRDEGVLGICKSKYFKSLGVLDEEVQPLIQSIIKDKPVVVFPDVIFEDGGHVQVKQEMPLEVQRRAMGRKTVLLIGELSQQKGILEFLKLAEMAQGHPFFFVVVGPLDEKSTNEDDRLRLNKILSQPRENLLVYNKRIENYHEYDSWIKNSNYLYAYYPSYFHSSNTVTKAALYKKPVLVNGGGLLETRILKHQIGIPTMADPKKQLQDLFLLDRLNVSGFYKDQYFNDYFGSHSFQTLKKSLGELLS